MKTLIKKTGDTIVVSIDGYLDFETHVPLREDLLKLIDSTAQESVSKKIIFNFEKLEFVGSSGISAFVHVLKEFNENAPTKPRYCHVRSEFKRIIQAFDSAAMFEFHENEERARKSFDQ